MADLYAEAASEFVSEANGETDPWWRDAYEELASEMVTLANQASGA